MPTSAACPFPTVAEGGRTGARTFPGPAETAPEPVTCVRDGAAAGQQAVGGQGGGHHGVYAERATRGQGRSTTAPKPTGATWGT
ncbi:hypothetical protein ACFYO0_40705 [Streptomyces sp. NPDC006365]|uniref:hypothetical protein n=1 Tax=Streptomyces sp. NPDC006365 TaxID=3364744 RepID=UPI0036B3D69C